MLYQLSYSRLAEKTRCTLAFEFIDTAVSLNIVKAASGGMEPWCGTRLPPHLSKVKQQDNGIYIHTRIRNKQHGIS